MLVGPYSLAAGAGNASAAIAESIRATIEALAAAGCQMIEIEEPAAVDIGEDAGRRRRFGGSLRTATAGFGDKVHLSLVLTGGNADGIGAATIYDLPFSSYAFDLLAGPENWRLIAEAPADRGIVCGALDPSADATDNGATVIIRGRYRWPITIRSV